MIKRLENLRKSSVFAEEKLVAAVQSLLLQIMDEKGVNYADLANRMGVSKARVSQIFSDHQNFTLRLVASAFHALGESVEIERSKPVEVKGMHCSHWPTDDWVVAGMLPDQEFIDAIARDTDLAMYESSAWNPSRQSPRLNPEYFARAQIARDSKEDIGRIEPDSSAWSGSNVINLQHRKEAYARQA